MNHLPSISQLQLEEGRPYVGYVKDPNYYFDGYSHFSIHEQMLKDSVRTQCYKRAIVDNPQLFKDKIVLDVGSGTGILSIFAARSGAKHVYGIEKANIYLHSRKIIQENNLTDKITIINGLVEEIQLPVQKVDIIISEWMGYFLLYQAMLDSVLIARDKWLAPGGIMMPNRAKMYVATVDDEAFYRKKLNYWNDVYGVSMKCMRKWVLSEPLVDLIDYRDILSNECLFYDIDLQKVKAAELDFTSLFTLKIQLEGQIHGFVTWFDCDFSHGQDSITLSTSPFSENTHWKQTIFYLDTPVEVYPGDIFQGSISVAKTAENPREVNVKFEFCFNNDKKPIKFYRIS